MIGGARDEVVPRLHMQELWDIIRDRGLDVNKKPSVGSVKGKEKEDIRSGSSRSTPMRATGSGSGPGPSVLTAPSKIVDDGRKTYTKFPDGIHSDANKRPLGSVKGKEKEDIWSGSSSSTPMLATGYGSGPSDLTVSSKVVDGGNTHIEKEEDVRSGSSSSIPSMPATKSGSGPGPGDHTVPPKIIDDGNNSRYIEFPDGMHSELCPVMRFPFLAHYPCADNTCVQPGYWPAVAEFVASLGRNKL